MTTGYDPLEHNKRLRQLKEEHKLSREDIAELLGAKFETVKNWLKLTTPPKCPPYAVELLEIKLKRRTPRGRRSSE